MAGVKQVLPALSYRSCRFQPLYAQEKNALEAQRGARHCARHADGRGMADPGDEPGGGGEGGCLLASDRHRVCVGAVQTEISREGDRRPDRAPAPRSSPGARRLSSAAGVRPPRPPRRLAGIDLRHPTRLHGGRRSSCDRRHGLSIDGARHSPFIRDDGPRPFRGCSRPARLAVGSFLVARPAACLAGRSRRGRHRFRRRPRRIRRGHYLRLQRSRRDPDASARHLLRLAGPGRRSACPAPRRNLDGGGHRRARRRRAFAALVAAEARGVSLVVEDAAITRGAFSLQATFEAPAEGVTVLFGPSGAGKSMLLSTVAGMHRLDRGRILWNGRVLEDAGRRERVAPHQRNIGLVFRDARLFPHLTVRGNLTYAERRRPADRTVPVVDEMALRLDIPDLLERPVRNLSGGEKGRVALARALLSAPDFLLLDEPFAALDGKRRRAFLALLRHASAAQGLPMIVVTHQIDDAAGLASPATAVHPGKVLAHGPAGVVMNSAGFAGLLDRRDIGARLDATAISGGDGGRGVWV